LDEACHVEDQVHEEDPLGKSTHLHDDEKLIFAPAFKNMKVFKIPSLLHMKTRVW